MNKSIFMGHLVRDPEIRYTDTEKGELMIANFRIGVKRKFVRKDGVDSDFFSVTAFGRLAEFVEKYFLQGSKVIVTGRMENDNYENTHGEKVSFGELFGGIFVSLFGGKFGFRLCDGIK